MKKELKKMKAEAAKKRFLEVSEKMKKNEVSSTVLRFEIDTLRTVFNMMLPFVQKSNPKLYEEVKEYALGRTSEKKKLIETAEYKALQKEYEKAGAELYNKGWLNV